MKAILESEKAINAKPFLKWAGGKTQLIPELARHMPPHIKSSKVIDSYVEPFVGGGAFFFYLKSHYEVKKAFLFDINRELILTYKVIQNDPGKLIERLEQIEKTYLKKTETERKEYYYKIREVFNKQMHNFNYEHFSDSWIERASYLIFLNKTCYNGLFRQNKKGEFNVPHGKYKRPNICDKDNIMEVHRALKDVEIICKDFEASKKYVKRGTFVYLDPPYLPISKTASFTQYSKEGFTEEDQVRLSKFFSEMDKRGAFLMLSNSDPKNEDPSNDFFDTLYKRFYIDRVKASRVINCIGNKRGSIKELIITNYKIGD
jgi:DNA adenine methylase